jgi:hypothetical protein
MRRRKRNPTRRQRHQASDKALDEESDEESGEDAGGEPSDLEEPVDDAHGGPAEGDEDEEAAASRRRPPRARVLPARVDRPRRRASAQAAQRVQQQARPAPDGVAGEFADGRSAAMADEGDDRAG